MFDRIGERYNGFTVTRIRTSEEITGRMVELVFDRTGTQVVWMDNGLENKLFSIFFKTLPEDSTGVFHILEHSLLCGSEKYPVREPFVELLKTSMNTFLNAMTFPDMTMYPVSSRNTRDFLNLTGVYLDAVFAPRILQDPNIFYQEGWHIEETEDGYGYNGVVFNEMKGAMSGPDRILSQKLQELLFKGTCYEYNSGGEPACIPDLTYEQFIRMYRKYYHPSNARIFLDGSIPAEETFALIGSYLSRFEKQDDCFEIPYVNAHPAEGTVSYELPREEPIEKREYLSVGILYGDWKERARNMAVSILKNVLFDANESPVKRALLSSGLIEDISVDIEDSMQQSYLEMSIRNMVQGKADEVLELIRETARAELEKGLDREELHATANLMEFRLLEPDEPLGLDHCLSATGAWLYGGDPMMYMLFREDFAKVRAMIDDGTMERLLREVIVDNPNWVIIHGIPSYTQGEEERRDEAERIAAVTDCWTLQQREANAELCSALAEWQQTPDTPEQLATLPKLPITEIDEQIRTVPTEEQEQCGTKVLYHEVACPGVIHFKLYFRLTDYSPDELFLIARAGNIFGRLSTERYSALELLRRMKSAVGRLDVGLDVSARKKQNATCTPYLSVACSVLEANLEEAQDLILEVLTKTDFRQDDKIREILIQSDESFKQLAVRAGQSLAARNAMAGYSATAALGDRISGYSAIRRMHAMVQDLDTEVPPFIELMEEMKKRVFCRGRLVVSVTASHPVFLEKLLSALPEGEPAAAEASYESVLPLHMGCPIPSKTSYSAKGILLNRAVDGSIRVAANIASLGFLWNMIRVQGGAYGTGVSASTWGGVSFYSYRDPEPARSLAVTGGIADYLRAFCESDEELDGYIISTLSDDEPLRTPREDGAAGDRMWFSGTTKEELLEERRQILGTTKEKILENLDVWEQFAAEGNYSIVGMEDKLKEQQDLCICPLL